MPDERLEKLAEVEKSGRVVPATVKFIDIFEDLGIEVNIYDDKVSIVAYDKKLPSGVLIKNAKISEAMRKIFQYLWVERAERETNLDA